MLYDPTFDKTSKADVDISSTSMSSMFFDSYMPHKLPVEVDFGAGADTCNLSGVGSAAGQLQGTNPHLGSSTDDKLVKLKPYRCTFQGCNKAYSKRMYLRAHQRVHSEEPFKCTWEGCSRKFSNSNDLARHRRKHTGEKPYSCATCGRKFARSDHLSLHAMSHVADSPVSPTRVIKHDEPDPESGFLRSESFFKSTAQRDSVSYHVHPSPPSPPG